jgi:hypothetical protein
MMAAGLLVAQYAPVAPVAPDATAAEDDGRIFGIIPDNKVPVPGAFSKALTSREKYRLAFRETADPFTFVLAGFTASVSQWRNTSAEFGQGGAGYAKRFGAAYADQAIGNYVTEAILPSLLKQDPRYFRKGTGTKWRRLEYAVTRVGVTRTDSGKAEFNYSEIAGNAAATGIGNLYYPTSERSARETGERFGVQVMSDGAFNVLLEFWPDVRRAMFRR